MKKYIYKTSIFLLSTSLVLLFFYLLGDSYYLIYTAAIQFVFDNLLDLSNNAAAKIYNHKLYLVFRNIPLNSTTGKYVNGFFSMEYLTHSSFLLAVLVGLISLSNETMKIKLRKIFIGLLILELFFILRLSVGGFEAYYNTLHNTHDTQYKLNLLETIIMNLNSILNKFGSISLRPILVLFVWTLLNIKLVIEKLNTFLINSK